MPAKDEPAAPWYRDGLRFECRRCRGCCGGFPGYVWITGDEIDRAADLLKVEPDEFITKYARRVGARYTLKEVKRWNCVFLTDDGCRIYPVRPVQCRTFPFWDENLQRRDDWDHAARSCPGMNDGKLYSCDEIERLRDEKRG